MRPPKPSTNRDPLIQQIFNEQDRLGISTGTFAKLSGIDRRALEHMRHPGIANGKRTTLIQARAMAEALEFVWPTKLQKNGD